MVSCARVPAVSPAVGPGDVREAGLVVSAGLDEVARRQHVGAHAQRRRPLVFHGGTHQGTRAFREVGHPRPAGGRRGKRCAMLIINIILDGYVDREID